MAITKLTASNAFYGYEDYTNSAAIHMYVGAENGSTRYDYRSRAAFPSLYSRVGAGESRIGIAQMTLYLYRNSGGATDFTVGCSDGGGWNEDSAVKVSGSAGDSDGWYAVDITPLAESVAQYRSNWFIHLGGGVPEVRFDGTGKRTRPYIMVEWEYAASTIGSDKDSVPLGGRVTFSIEPEVPGETHTLTYALGDAKGTIASAAGDRISWTPPKSLAAQITDDDTAAVQIRMTAQDASGKALRTELFCQTVSVPASVRPEIASVGAELTGGLAGYGLSGRTGIAVGPVIDMNQAYGASIVSVTAAVTGGKSVRWAAFPEGPAGVFRCARAETGAVFAEGEVTVKVTATDSRGRTASDSRTFTFCEYSPPVISAFSVERCEPVRDENEEVTGHAASDLGNRVWVNMEAAVFPVAPEGAPLNSLKWSITGTRSATGETVSASGTGGQAISVANDRAVFPGEVGGDESWSYALTVTDAAGAEAAAYSSVAEAHAAFSVSPDKRGFAVGMIAAGTREKPMFEVAKDYESRLYGGVSGADGRRLDRPVCEAVSISNANFAAYSDSLSPRVSRVGPMVLLDGFATNTADLAAGFSETVAVLPDWARPATDVSVIQQGSGEAVWWLRIYTDGSVGAGRYRKGAEYADAAAGRQFPLTARWIAADAYEGG